MTSRTIAACIGLLLAVIVGVQAPSARAAGEPFAPGWTLQPGASTLSFQSVKKQVVAESSGFASFSGRIDLSGQAEIRILLDSVDTKVDLRNVRMRFLFFETFKYPEAVVKAAIDPALLADLPAARRKTVPIEYTLDLHGVAKTLTADVVVTQIADDMVAVSSGIPISLLVADFGLSEGLTKLEQAANVTIVPTTTVSFDFVFRRDGEAPATGPAVTAAAPALAPAPAAAALETAGDLDADACRGRFEILSRTGNIFFRSGSATLDPASAPLLTALADIVRRCPSMVIEVSGHTDSDGGDRQNLALSQERAGSVAAALVAMGLPSNRFETVGRGETMPVVANDTPENKARNRRIEFAVKG